MDATTNLLVDAGRKENKGASVFPMSSAVWNIDDVDGRMYMINHDFSGCYALMVSKKIDPAHPGELLVDGVKAGKVVLGTGFRGLQAVGLFLRGTLREYGREYQVEYKGAVDVDGIPLEPYAVTVQTLPKVSPGESWAAHDPLVFQAAEEGIVLLKNENGALPLGKGAAVNAFGAGAAIFRLGTVGAGKINPRYGIRFERGIQEYSSLRLNEELFAFYTKEEEVLPPEEMLAAARAKSDTAVYVITRGTGESIDNRPVKGEYYLTDAEQAMLSALRRRFKKLVVVLNVGYPIAMDWVDIPDAILWVGLPGMAGGAALAEILEGTVSPSGRLPDSWARDYWDIPASRNFNIPGSSAPEPPEKPGDKVKYNVAAYEEGLYVGYRYFSTFGKKPAYPFGHGLGYTVFQKEVVRFTHGDDHCEMTVRVRNVGKALGKESVLIFAKLPDGKLEQPERRLAAYGKTGLLYPGAAEELVLSMPSDRFDSFDPETAQWVIEPGEIALYLGGSVEEAEKAAVFTVPERIVLSNACHYLACPVEFHTMSKFTPDYWPEGKLSAIVEADELPYKRERELFPEFELVQGTGYPGLVTFPMVKEHPELLGDFVLQLSDEQLCRMSVGARTGWGPGDNGFAGTIYREGVLAELELPEYYFSDGNNGLNMNDANIGFPTSNLIAATFNERLSYEEGRAIAQEAKGMQLQNILAPSMNIHRNPLCGRQAEYFSEDPLLAGRMGGMESMGLEAEGVASCVKHFIANSAETYRNTAHALIDERTVREIYLKVFQYALTVHQPDSMMTSYNPCNGAWCAGDPELLMGILRGEWGYKGYVMTDWGSTERCDAVATAAAGNSWIAPGEMDDSETAPMVQAMADGRLDRERIRTNVYRMMQSLIRY